MAGGCGGCGSTFKRHGFDSGAMTTVVNGRVYPLASYSDCTRMYGGGRKYSRETVMVVARENAEYERIFNNRNEASRYKRQLQRQGVHRTVAKMSAVMARDLCHDAVVELFEPTVVQENESREAVK